MALYIDVLFIPYSLAGAAGQGLAAGCFHPQSLVCLWLQPTLSRPLKVLLTLSKNRAIHPQWSSTESLSAVPLPYFAASPGPDGPWKAGGLDKRPCFCWARLAPDLATVTVTSGA